jgi:uncharacterized protein YjbJ (UPF0337 family)
MKQGTTDEARGNFHELKGKAKEKVGRVINNPDLEAEGIVEKIAGKIQKKIGQLEQIVDKP